MNELRLRQPLSFWGGVDPETGVIIDVHHPQFGESIAGKHLVLERTAGSTSSSGALLEMIRLGNAPAAITVGRADMTIASAVFMAKVLYDIDVPLSVRMKT